VYTKIAGNSGGSGTSDTRYVIGGSSNWSGVVTMWAFSNSTLIDVASATMGQANSDPVSPTINATGNNGFLISLAYWYKTSASAPTTPSLMTLQRNSLNYNASGSAGLGWNYSTARQAITSGNTAPKTWTVASTKPAAWDALTIAVK
jgi:hypothetical protein